MATPKSVIIRSLNPIRNEVMANETITPGNLVEYVRSGGPAGRLKNHASAGGPCLPMFAVEAGEVGNGIGDNYASGDKVWCIFPEKGARIYARLASGQNVGIGQELMSDGLGLLKAWATSNTQPSTIVARAIEAVNASSAAARITVEVL